MNHYSSKRIPIPTTTQSRLPNQRNTYDYSQDVPLLKFVNETNGHEPLHNSEIVMFIPHGKRCLFWFTTKGNQNICVVLEAFYVNNIAQSYTIKTMFETSLCTGRGTVLRGTYFYYKDVYLGAIEDIYYYKGKQTQHMSLVERLGLLNQLFTYELKQSRLFKQNVVMSICITKSGKTPIAELEHIIRSLPYKLKYVQYRFNTKTTNICNINVDSWLQNITNKILPSPSSSNTTRINTNISRKQHNLNNIQIGDMVFKIRAELQSDIYRLYTYGQNGEDVFHGYAGIQNYDTSAFMNKLFRKIKENDNLDFLEESDDEEEFENVDIDKYVHLNVTKKIVCKYMANIDKWIPYKSAHFKSKITTSDQLRGLGKQK